MQVRIDRETFTEAVSWVARSLQPNPAKPILGGILIEATEDDALVLSSHNVELGAKVSIAAQVDAPGSCVVNGKLLADFAKSCPNKPIVLATEGAKLTVECGSVNIQMGTLPVEDYPQAQELPALVGTVDGADWQEAVAQVASCASNDDTLPLLAGIRIIMDSSTLTLMATDRYRLGVRTLPWKPEDPSIDRSIIVKAARLSEITRAIGSAGSIELYADDDSNSIGVVAAGRSNVIRRIEGEYPDVMSLFQDQESYIVADRREMIDSLKRASLVTIKHTAVRLTFAEGQITLEAGQGENATMSETIEASLHGEELAVSFQPDNLRGVLDVIPEDYVRMAYISSRKSFTLTGQEKLDGEDNPAFRSLQMPSRL